MARPRSLKYSLSLLLTVPMVRGGARCVKDDLVVLPKALEEPQGSAIAIAVPRCKLQKFGRGSVPVDGAEQPVLERVDSANKISKFVRPVYQHRDAANAHRPWQWRCNLTWKFGWRRGSKAYRLFRLSRRKTGCRRPRIRL